MKLKICGMRRQEDLAWAEQAGFDYCGFIFHPKSPRYVKPEQVRQLNSGRMARVGVFVEQDAGEVAEIMAAARLDLAQLHGSQSRAAALRIGPERVIRVLWPDRCADARELQAQAAEYANSCAWLLLDAGASGGGSGQRVAVAKLAGLRLPRPWFLAGGVAPDNLADIMSVCRPDGLDFNSGLEDAPGVKSKTKIIAAKETLEQMGEK